MPISIIIPTYNRADVIGDTITSVLSQISEDWELIIVDDGSTDQTSEKIKEFISDERITFVKQKQSGVSQARNFGAEIARGSHLIFLDSDDLIAPDLIQCLNHLQLSYYDLICWEVERLRSGHREIIRPKKLDKTYNNLRAIFLAGSFCVRRSVFLKVGGYDSKMLFGENYELGMRLSEIQNIRVKIIHQPFLYYKICNTNRTSNSLANRKASYLHLYQKHKTKYKSDTKAHSTMVYLIGYVYEQEGEVARAQHYYTKAFRIYPWNFKALCKILLLIHR